MVALAFALTLAVGGLRVEVRPERPFVEDLGWARRLNFDLVIHNDGANPLRLDEVQVSSYDGGNVLASRRALRAGGSSPALRTLNVRAVPARDWVLLFNPFHTWDPGTPLDRLRYELTFTREGDEATPLGVTVEVAPRPWRQRTRLVPPVKGRFVVWDGHDFYSHHRRWDLAERASRDGGLRHNVDRYAYDLSVVDPAGRMFAGDGSRPEDWFGFGATLYAPGAGTVVEAVGSLPDRGPDKVDWDRVQWNPRLPDGNYVLIDHGNGEWSALLHMKQGSVLVKPGQRVRRDEPIGQMGFSGDAITVHVHYRLQGGPGPDVEGLPSFFTKFRRLAGARTTAASKGAIDTGDILER